MKYTIQQGNNVQWKLSRDTHGAYGFCTFGTKLYAQLTLINTY